MHRNIQIAVCVTLLFALLQGCQPTGTKETIAGPEKTTSGTEKTSAGAKKPISHQPAATMSDAEFAKSAFNALAKGDQDVADKIDWENFQVATQNVGTSYSAFSDEANRAGFRKAFITSFSASFHGTGAKEDSLKNWKVKQEGADQSIVSAETLSKKHLLITVSKKGGVQKMIGIQNGP